MNKYSKNAKLNAVLTAIESDLKEFGMNEVKRYYKEFPREPDYNIVQYGCLLCYYHQVYDFYRAAGYTSTDSYSAHRIWELYKRQVGYVVRILVKENLQKHVL
jgi:outer membrane protein assembly factor BamD (BamD/ComL family)